MPNQDEETKDTEVKKDDDIKKDTESQDTEDDIKKDTEVKKDTPQKGVSELDDIDKAYARIKELENRISSFEKDAELNKQMAESRALLKEDDISVEDDLLKLFVTTDSKTTLNNINILKNFYHDVEKKVEQRVSSGYTPNATQNTKKDPLQEMLKKYK